MNSNKKYIPCAFLCLAVLTLTSCTSTGMVSTWTDMGSPQPSMEKLLIVGVADRQENRALFEETLAKELGQKGFETVKSTALIPESENLDTQTVLAEAKKQGIAFVMVTRILEIGEKETLVPEYNPILWAYESGGNAYGALNKFHKTRQITEKYVKLQTNLYDTKADKMIWSAISETQNPGTALSAKDVIDSVCATVSEELRPSNARG